MKRYALVVSLALLFAAFLWSCQQQDSAPLSPEGSITLGKGKPPPKPEAATYTVVFNVKPPGEANFIEVGRLDNAVANRKEDVLTSEEMSMLNISSFRSSFIDLALAISDGAGVGTSTDLWFLTGAECEEFARLFTLPLPEPDPESPDNSYDAIFLNVRKYVTPEDPGLDSLFTGWFRGEDSHGYGLGTSFYGIIDKTDPTWLPQNSGESNTIRSILDEHPAFDPEGPITGKTTSHVDRLSMSFATGKGKNKERCLWGFHNHPWKIVITRNP